MASPLISHTGGTPGAVLYMSAVLSGDMGCILQLHNRNMAFEIQALYLSVLWFESLNVL